MKKFFRLSIILAALGTVVACSDKRTPQMQYMPDMYVAVPYEADGVIGENEVSTNLKPVANTIARGNVPYEYENTNEDYDKAKAELKSPLAVNEENLENGKKMYGIYCAVCHGKKGDGNGVLSEREKFSGVPNYKDREITEGSIYHVIMHGRNTMGSHSSQLTYKERWQVVQYVQQLRNDLTK